MLTPFQEERKFFNTLFNSFPETVKINRKWNSMMRFVDDAIASGKRFEITVRRGMLSFAFNAWRGGGQTSFTVAFPCRPFLADVTNLWIVLSRRRIDTFGFLFTACFSLRFHTWFSPVSFLFFYFQAHVFLAQVNIAHWTNGKSSLWFLITFHSWFHSFGITRKLLFVLPFVQLNDHNDDVCSLVSFFSALFCTWQRSKTPSC